MINIEGGDTNNENQTAWGSDYGCVKAMSNIGGHK